MEKSDSTSSTGLEEKKRRMIWCEWWGGAMRSIETLVTSQNAADCCKVFVGCRAWLQIRWPFFFLFLHPCFPACCTPACLHSGTLFSQTVSVAVATADATTAAVQRRCSAD